LETGERGPSMLWDGAKVFLMDFEKGAFSLPHFC
jgi:hypothetical protein